MLRRLSPCNEDRLVASDVDGEVAVQGAVQVDVEGDYSAPVVGEGRYADRRAPGPASFEVGTQDAPLKAQGREFGERVVA